MNYYDIKVGDLVEIGYNIIGSNLLYFHMEPSLKPAIPAYFSAKEVIGPDVQRLSSTYVYIGEIGVVFDIPINWHIKNWIKDKESGKYIGVLFPSGVRYLFYSYLSIIKHSDKVYEDAGEQIEEKNQE